MSKRTLLAVLAHPDDESFGMGGTLALYASRGVEVHLVCATRGEAGVADDLIGHASIAELREAELRCAAEILGLTGVHFLDYRDSGMPGASDNHHPRALAIQPLDEVAVKVVRYIRELKPQIVVTFDPIGGYHHPDHVAIHQATVRAFKQAANAEFASGGPALYQPPRLYFHIIPRGFLRFSVWLLRLLGRDPSRWGRNNDIDLTVLAAGNFPIHARIDIRPVRKKKEQAAACHASQGGGQMRRNLIGGLLRMFSDTEIFMRAYPPVQKEEGLERDLFANVSSRR